MGSFGVMLLASLPLASAVSATEYVLPSYRHLAEKMAAGEDITIVYFGGSITMGAMTYPGHGVNRDGEAYDYRNECDPEKFSWRARSFAALQEKYEQRPGQFHMVNAAVGATDSELGAYRLAHHVLADNPDLLFIEFAINDNGVGLLSDDPEAERSIYRTLSSIVSRARAANPNLAVFIPVSTARDLDPAQYVVFQPARAHHMRFAEMFHIPYVDIHHVFFESPLPEGVTVANVFDGPDSPGCRVHPSPRGHEAYAAGVCSLLDELLTRHRFAFKGPRREAWFEPYPRNPRFLLATELPVGGGWSLQDGTAFTHLATHVCRETKTLFTDRPGAHFQMDFEGSAVFLWGQQHYPGQGDISGQLSVRVDGTERAVFADPAHRQGDDLLLQRMMPVVRNLDPALNHVLEVVTLPLEDGGPTRVALHGIGLDEAPSPR